MKKLLFLIGCLGLVIFISGCDRAVLTSFFVKEEQQLIYTGMIEAEQYHICSEINGKVIEIKVREGQEIGKNDLIAVLDTELLEIQKKQAQVQVKVNQAQLNEMLAGSRNQQLQQAQANIEGIRANIEAQQKVLDILQKKLQDTKSLYEAGGATAGQIDELKMQIATTEGQMNALKANLDSAKAGRDLLIEGAASQSIDVLENMVEQSKVSLELIEAQLKKSRIYSYHDGIVQHVHVDTGEMVTTGAPVATLVDLNNLSLKIYIPEKHISKVRVGQILDITSDAYSDKIFQGTVTFVAPQAEFTPKNVETKEERAKTLFEVKIDLGDEKKQLKPGMMVDVLLK